MLTKEEARAQARIMACGILRHQRQYVMGRSHLPPAHMLAGLDLLEALVLKLLEDSQDG